jgi:hypothetical protein
MSYYEPMPKELEAKVVEETRKNREKEKEE